MSTVDGRYKYTYWWYGDDSMEPFEELYDLEKDPLEMVNLADNPEHAPALKMMRKKYDDSFQHLKTNAVSYNKYQQYGVLFDRNVPVSEKPIKKPAKKSKKKREKSKNK